MTDNVDNPSIDTAVTNTAVTNTDDIECTAIDRSGDPATANVLFTPPCACPRCAPQRFDAEAGPAVLWLPVDGRPVRHRVENLTLGPAGVRYLGQQRDNVVRGN